MMLNESEYQARLDDYAGLKEGWNSYDAAPITPEAIATARRFSPDHCPIAFWPVPTPHGGIQIEIHQEGYDFEIEILPDGQRFGYCWTNLDDAWVDDGVASEAEVRTLIARVAGGR